jgi:hypothetical protein
LMNSTTRGAVVGAVVVAAVVLVLRTLMLYKCVVGWMGHLGAAIPPIRPLSQPPHLCTVLVCLAQIVGGSHGLHPIKPRGPEGPEGPVRRGLWRAPRLDVSHRLVAICVQWPTTPRVYGGRPRLQPWRLNPRAGVHVVDAACVVGFCAAWPPSAACTCSSKRSPFQGPCC